MLPTLHVVGYDCGGDNVGGDHGGGDHGGRDVRWHRYRFRNALAREDDVPNGRL